MPFLAKIRDAGGRNKRQTVGNKSTGAPLFVLRGTKEVQRALRTAEQSRSELRRGLRPEAWPLTPDPAASRDLGQRESFIDKRVQSTAPHPLSGTLAAFRSRGATGSMAGISESLPSGRHGAGAGPVSSPVGLLSLCANPDCQTGWLRAWRRRRAPIFEGKWACSERCMEMLLRAAVQREIGSRLELTGSDPGSNAASERHRHRLPLGLVLLAHGWITQAQLRRALDVQKERGKGRIGSWLVGQGVVEEAKVTRALSMQWGCPVLSLSGHQPEEVAPLVPRLFIDALGLLPVRIVGGRLLYLAFEDRVDAAAAFAVERVTGLQVEPGVVAASEFLPGYERMMAASFPKARIAEAADAGELTTLLSEAVERMQPVQSRLVRLHQYFWMRCWFNASRAPGLGNESGPTEVEWAEGDRPARVPAGAIPRAYEVEDLLIAYGRSN